MSLATRTLAQRMLDRFSVPDRSYAWTERLKKILWSWSVLAHPIYAATSVNGLTTTSFGDLRWTIAVEPVELLTYNGVAHNSVYAVQQVVEPFRPPIAYLVDCQVLSLPTYGHYHVTFYGEDDDHCTWY